MNLDPDLLAALDAGETPKVISLRFGEEAGRWSSVQSELRQKARSRFGEQASRMLFVREALEQASHPLAARYRASLFPAGETVVDLTAGIGSDLIALAARGPARGIELDPERAAYAAHNTGVPVAAADALRTELTPYWIADPARRSGGRRIIDADDFAPPLSSLLERARTANLAIIKLSPMLPDRVLQVDGAGLEFLSVGGECREAMLLLGSEAQPGRRAVLITPEVTHTLDASDPGEPVTSAGAYLYDADPAAIRAHALGSVASASRRCTSPPFSDESTGVFRIGEMPMPPLAPLGDSPGYLTGDEALESPWLRRYRVRDTGAFHVREIKEGLRRGGLRIFETKKRGVGEAPLAKLKGLPKEGEPVSLILWAVGSSIRYALASPELASSK